MKTDIFKRTLAGACSFEAAEAARLIGEWNGREYIPDLIEHGRTNRLYHKVNAIYALAKLNAKEAIPALTDLVAEPNVSNDWYWTGYKGVRAAAAVSLLKLGSNAGVDYLRELAEKKEITVTRWFAPELLRLGPTLELQSYLTVEKLCPEEMQRTYGGPEYSEPGMLCMLCEALGLIDDPGVEPRLEFYFDHYSRFVRGQAYRSLFRRKGDKATAQKIADNARKHGTDFELLVVAEIQKDDVALARIAREASEAVDRGAAIDALAAISSPKLIEAGKLALQNSDVYVRQCAVEALGRRHAGEATQIFDAVLGDEKETRVLCAVAATQLGGKSS